LVRRHLTLLFAMMFKWLPDAPVDWRNVWRFSHSRRQL
jgi:hypothetical protein